MKMLINIFIIVLPGCKRKCLPNIWKNHLNRAKFYQKQFNFIFKRHFVLIGETRMAGYYEISLNSSI